MLTLSACSFLPEKRVYNDIVIPNKWHEANDSSIQVSASENINFPASTLYNENKVEINKSHDLSHYKSLLNSLKTNELTYLIQLMLSNNNELKALNNNLAQSKNTFDNNDANLFPTLSAAFKFARDKDDGDPASYNSNFKASLGASYTIDIWGALSDERKLGFYIYQKNKIAYEKTKLSSVTALIKLYFALVHNNVSLKLIKNQFDNISERLLTIETKYQQGLASLLDVYLAKNSLHSADASLLKVTEKRSTIIRKISLLLGSYPNINIINTNVVNTTAVQKIATPTLPIRIPSDVMLYRADIQSAWLDVLIKESALAIAHKNRFPKLSLSAGIDRSDSELGELVSNGILNWNLTSNLTAPIFDASRLATKQENALLELTKTEYKYTTITYNAFAQVETTLSNISTLKKAMALDKLSLDNVVKAEELASDQYQLGLIDFIKVLDAQKRAMTAKLTEADNKLALLNASIDLYVALGGSINFSNELPIPFQQHAMQAHDHKKIRSLQLKDQSKLLKNETLNKNVIRESTTTELDVDVDVDVPISSPKDEANQLSTETFTNPKLAH